MSVPRQPLLEVLVRLATEAADETPEALLRLAAHLFALGLWVQVEERHGLQFSTPRPRAVGTLRELLSRLRSLSTASTGGDLFELSVAGLLAIEEELTSTAVNRTRVRGALPLDPFFGGSVRCWLHPPSALAALRRRRASEAESHPGGRRPERLRLHPASDLDRLGFYWHDGRLEVAVRRVAADGELPLVAESGPRAEGGAFKVALCPLLAGVYPRFVVTENGNGFWACRDCATSDETKLQAALQVILERAMQDQIHLVVLPELAIHAAARDELERRLRSTVGIYPFGIVAGSLHVWRDGAERLPVNEAVLFDDFGETLLTHWKRGPYRLTREQLLKAPHFFSNAEKFPAGAGLADEIVEAIRHGAELQFLETTLGRLVVLICADANDKELASYVHVVERLEPDLVLLVSMTMKTEPFDGFSSQMARRRIGTLFVNAACVSGRGELLAQADVGVVEPTGAAPTRLRWLSRGAEGSVVEVYDRSVREPANRWREAREDEQGDAGVAWLDDGEGHRLGWILDIGVHWR